MQNMLESHTPVWKVPNKMEKYAKWSSSGVSPVVVIVHSFINNLNDGIEYFIKVPVEKVILDLIISFYN